MSLYAPTHVFACARVCMPLVVWNILSSASGCADDFLHNLVPENRDIGSRYKNYKASMYTYFLERVSFETLFRIM
jgi:hypothetical protein